MPVMNLRYALYISNICLRCGQDIFGYAYDVHYLWDNPKQGLNMPDIWLRYSQDIPYIWLIYDKCIPEIFLRHVWNRLEIYPKCIWYIPEIYPSNTLVIPEIIRRYLWYIQEIYQRSVLDIPKIKTRYAWDLFLISLGYTCSTCKNAWPMQPRH